MNLRVVLASLILSSAWTSVPSQAETIEEKAKQCAACHGDNGIPNNPDAPIIWGQHAGYLYIELKDFKSKNRKSDIMNGIAEQMEKPDMLALAEYFEAQTWPKTGYAASQADNVKGDSIGTAGMCTSCHLGSFLGDGSIPHIAGQTQVYLEKTLLAFKSRERNNNVDKSNLMQTFSDEDLKAMTRYVAGIQ